MSYFIINLINCLSHVNQEVWLMLTQAFKSNLLIAQLVKILTDLLVKHIKLDILLPFCLLKISSCNPFIVLELFSDHGKMGFKATFNFLPIFVLSFKKVHFDRRKLHLAHLVHVSCLLNLRLDLPDGLG